MPSRLRPRDIPGSVEHSDMQSVLPAVFEVVFAAALAILIVGCCLWVVNDARRRGKSPLAVFLLVVLSFPLGLAVWLVFRPEPAAVHPARMGNHPVPQL